MIRPCFNRLSSAVRTVFDGMAKPIPCEPPCRRGDRRVDPNHFAAEVDQRPATVSRIDRSIGLNQISKEIGPVRSSLRADDSVCHRFFESKWVADGQNKVPGCTMSESASLSGLTFGSSILSTARSTSESAPTNRAFLVCPSLNCTSI